jgi:hypothetical protein
LRMGPLRAVSTEGEAAPTSLDRAECNRCLKASCPEGTVKMKPGQPGSLRLRGLLERAACRALRWGSLGRAGQGEVGISSTSMDTVMGRHLLLAPSVEPG